ncbi:MAG: clan AA aspartic protease [Chitinophagales bacterium]|nr:clan AA aspartic protease [Chitinophagales bacterium]
MAYTIPLIIKTIPPKGYHIFVDGKIGRHKMRFLIDTGASKSVINQDYAQNHFSNSLITKTDHLTTGLGANIPNSSFIRLHRVKLDKFSLKTVHFALLDLSMVNQAYSSAGLDPVEAIIGGDILKKYGAVIDYGNKQLIMNQQ